MKAKVRWSFASLGGLATEGEPLDLQASAGTAKRSKPRMRARYMNVPCRDPLRRPTSEQTREVRGRRLGANGFAYFRRNSILSGTNLGARNAPAEPKPGTVLVKNTSSCGGKTPPAHRRRRRHIIFSSPSSEPQSLARSPVAGRAKAETIPPPAPPACPGRHLPVRRRALAPTA